MPVSDVFRGGRFALAAWLVLMACAVTCIVTTGLALAPTEARAQPTPVPRLIVLRFAGSRGDEAREAVLVAIASYVELVEEERAVLAAQEEGIDLTSPQGMSELAVAMGITLVITGEVQRDGTTVLTVVNPRGDELSRAEVPGARRRPDEEALGPAAVQAVNDAQAELARRREAEEAAAAAAAAAAEPEPEPIVPIEEEPPAPAPQGWRQPLMIVAGGIRLRDAATVVRLRDGRGTYFASDPYAEIDLYALFHPLTDAPDLSRGLIFGLQGSFSVGAGYTGEAPGFAPHGMTSVHLRADVGFGYTASDIFEIAGLVGYCLDSMSLDQADGFPSAMFSSLRIGALGRARAFEDLVVVEFGIGGRIGLDAGELASGFGESVGFGGVDLFAGLSGTVEGFHWMARFGFSHLTLGFSGAPGTYGEGESGSDETFEGRFLVGYAF